MARAGVVEQQTPRRGDHGVEARVVERADGRPRVHRLDEQDLALEDVADTCHHTLIGECFGDQRVGA
jgi:hypothetical protein